MIIIYPTDTVWGIGASIFDEKGTLEVHQAKGSSPGKPMSVLFHNEEQIEEFIHLDDLSEYLPLIEVLKKESTVLIPLKFFKKEIPSYIYCDSDKVGVRLAEDFLGKELSSHTPDPVTTTSLNRSTESPILEESKAIKFKEDYAPQAVFIPSEKSLLSGSPSTIISLEENKTWTIVREGARKNELETLLGI